MPIGNMMDGDGFDIRRRPPGFGSASSPARDPFASYSPLPDALPDDGSTRLDKVLLSRGAVSDADLRAAHATGRRLRMPHADILLAQGHLTEVDLLTAASEAHGIGVTDLRARSPDPDLAPLLSASDAIALRAVPSHRVGSAVVVVTSNPANLPSLHEHMDTHDRIIPALAPRDQVAAAQVALYGDTLVRRAEGQARAQDSCRNWRPDTIAPQIALVGLACIALGYAFPVWATGLLFGLTFLVFTANILLKAAAFCAAIRGDRLAAATAGTDQSTRSDGAAVSLLRPPIVTLLVPLYKEREIAKTLIANLSALDYPPERLDVILAVEADDVTTQAALTECHLPHWIRAIHVPPGHPRTKPRALNFALNFARGSLIGIYDAEDRPEPDQINKVVNRFAESPQDVVCLQGRLDYYNSTYNSLARFFAIEYANWFRVLLPGVQRLGLFVPLGGTTLFLRRDALEEVGAWDAHNVTEDADLGLRLATHGYRTEIIETTTYEEANAAILPWIRQRSRWQKGYLMTWSTAMRHPRALLRGLGLWRFAGLQVQVLFAVVGFLIAPLLWSLMVKPFGMAHPLDAFLSPFHYGLLMVPLVGSLVLNIGLSLYATRAAHLRPIRPWILVSEFYFVLGTFAAWRAVAEILLNPFFWSKTAHGEFGGAQAAVDAIPAKGVA